MRIGIVSEYSRPWPGGISEHVHHEAVELRKLGHDVLVITAGDSLGRDSLEREGRDEIRVLRVGRALPLDSNGARGRLALGSFVWRMQEVLNRQDLDMLHVHAPLDPCLPLCAVLAATCPVIGTFHASFEHSAFFELLYRANPLARRAWHKLAARIAVSEEAERCIARYFPGEYRVISNGVDVTRFHARGEDHPKPPSRAHQVLFVGRADARKGLAKLIEAHALLIERGMRTELVLCGVRANEIEHLLEAIPERARTSVRALGYVSPEALPEQYRSADVFCSPATHAESQGIVLLEAMASHLPCVCFDIPGYRDVVQHDVTAWVASEPTPQALANALERVLSDDLLRARLGNQAAGTAGDYAWPKIAQALSDLFLSLVRESDSILSRVQERDGRASSAAAPTHGRTPR